MEFVMPAFACIVVVFGLIKKVPVCIHLGSKRGSKTSVQHCPYNYGACVCR